MSKGSFRYYIDKISYKSKEPFQFIYFTGWCFHLSGKPVNFAVYINDQKVNAEIHRFDRKDVVKKYNETDGKDIGFIVRVSDIFRSVYEIKLVAQVHQEKMILSCLNRDQLNRLDDKSIFEYSIDLYQKMDNRKNGYVISGWAIALDKQEISFEVLDCNNKVIESSLQLSARKDLVARKFISQDQAICGFQIVFSGIENEHYSLKLSTETDEKIIPLNSEMQSILKYLQLMNVENVKKAYKFWQKYGSRKLIKRVFQSRDSSQSTIDYNEWAKKRDATEVELARQRNHKFSISPKMSLVVATFNTPIPYLKQMIETVINQTYYNWELCVADGSTNKEVVDYIQNKYSDEKRIKVVQLDKNYGIAGNMNEAIKIATGDFIGLYDHDDALAPNALFEFVKAINQNNDLKVIYSDEDKIDSEWTRRFEPHFKSDFNLDLLCTNNYICHLLFVKKELMEQVGYLKSEFDGAQDHDFVLRCVEKVKNNQIYHIPKVLYHWRIHENSTAGNPESKMYAFDAGVRACQAHFDRQNLHVKVSHGPTLGFYRNKYILDNYPLVSIIIPNKDHIDDLDRCLRSIANKSTYKNYEIIIVENNSTEKNTFDYYKQLEEANANIKVVYWEDEFNYSAINNYGVTFAKGEYILLLNNDTEVINPVWIEELLGFCMRKDVGAVGAKLYYPDDTIQHAGVIIGLGGVAGHCFSGLGRNEYGYFGRLICSQDLSAVTAACLMTKKSIFEEVHGLDETFKVAFNDIDYCLKLREKGYLVVFNPYVELYHYESKSRGFENTRSKAIRFQNEIDGFEAKWNQILKHGDPYYNVNFSRCGNGFTLKKNIEKEI
ncbi:capsular polysaccharide synthesis protein CpsIbJ [Faecalicoccus pleomorphus]|uniref:Capsular polysaccharide synthesis protein CpsIbJ n=1 Tax=Faecalicoccus pleomorphus TaxID=1323 RepID=A0A380LNI7_9FIRM|nr:glycosyltransferase family 2 protein [Faecalicoccus pleomorphus]SUO04160.1 capsular polysaccharide synthesis protein CpsIbJ [Faecalicoccus pleomorphus]